MIDSFREQELQEQLKGIRLKVKARMRWVFIWLGGVLGNFLLVVAYVPIRPWHRSLAETFGMFPIISLVVLGTALVIAGWLTGSAENNARSVEFEIQDMYENDSGK
ncbi:MAG TPA: hypothetical protein PLW99_01350 [Candidatus Paceibacterota bacterium]|nr:MAG: hypothetical protein B7X03_00965 [Parcubacteria group bacterium 21-58-10]HQT82777.1 hypothetical protein [Candidatus Paceibacterota bacterium]